MALDDVQHVEAVAIIKALLEASPAIPVTAREGTEAWLADHHPEPHAYSAAMLALSGKES